VSLRESMARAGEGLSCATGPMGCDASPVDVASATNGAGPPEGARLIGKASAPEDGAVSDVLSLGTDIREGMAGDSMGGHKS
jgi:hypothetical protein